MLTQADRIRNRNRRIERFNTDPSYKIWCLQKLDAIRKETEGTPSSKALSFCKNHGVPIPKWAKDCWNKKLVVLRSKNPEIYKQKRPYERYAELHRKSQREYYSRSPEVANARVLSYLFLRRHGLLKKGWEIHHPLNTDHKLFFYFPRSTHRMLHTLFGSRNEDVSIDRIYDALDLIPEYQLFINYTLVDEVSR